jgi:hypothetical protein
MIILDSLMAELLLGERASSSGAIEAPFGCGRPFTHFERLWNVQA